MIKIFLTILTFLTFSSYATNSYHGLDASEQNVINASTNARGHSNMGNVYFAQGNFISALTEYKIAYALTYENTISSYYLYNIAKCYEAMGQAQNSKIFLEEAISKDCMNLTYYKALAKCYKLLKIDNKELQRCLKDEKNPYNRILAGFIYIENDNKISAKNIFDEFINKNPDMLISNDLKNILKTL